MRSDCKHFFDDFQLRGHPFAIPCCDPVQRAPNAAPCVYIVRGELAVGVPRVHGLTVIFDDARVSGGP